ncbi:hypothetical protein BGW41_002419 [Actinomortierella wolfii]|nr:hypothetical protein BGW41_002419 [Actinomortierella wolfii]
MTCRSFIYVLATFLGIIALCASTYAQSGCDIRPDIMVVTSPNYDNYTVGEELTVDIYIRDEDFKDLNPWTKIYIEKHHPKPALKKRIGKIRVQDLENPNSEFQFTLKKEWLTSKQKDVPYRIRVTWDEPECGYEFSEDFYFHT